MRVRLQAVAQCGHSPRCLASSRRGVWQQRPRSPGRPRPPCAAHSGAATQACRGTAASCNERHVQLAHMLGTGAEGRALPLAVPYAWASAIRPYASRVLIHQASRRQQAVRGTRGRGICARLDLLGERPTRHRLAPRALRRDAHRGERDDGHGRLFYSSTTHFSHMSHTPFPHTSEFNPVF